MTGEMARYTPSHELISGGVRQTVRGIFRQPRLLRRLCADGLRDRDLVARSSLLGRWLSLVGADFEIVYLRAIPASAEALAVFDLRRPVILRCSETDLIRATCGVSDAARQVALDALSRAAALHCLTHSAGRLVSELVSRRSHVIHPSADLAFFRPSDRRSTDGVFRLLSVTNLDWPSGLDHTLGAVRILLDAGLATELRIVGNGAEWQRTMNAVFDLGLEGHVQIDRGKNALQLRAVLDRSDAFVYGCVADGFSDGLLPAMASGLPVITTDTGGGREFVSEGVDGLLVKPRDSIGLATILADLASRPARQVSLGQNARLRVAHEFSVEREVRGFESLVQEIRG
jgi:glycosyltransferase involved in cell wall biosynthesis